MRFVSPFGNFLQHCIGACWTPLGQPQLTTLVNGNLMVMNGEMRKNEILKWCSLGEFSIAAVRNITIDSSVCLGSQGSMAANRVNEVRSKLKGTRQAILTAE